MDLKETDILGEAIGSHWYYQFKGNALLQLIANVKPARILDVGAGSGFFSRLLLERTPCMEAFCIDPSYEKEHVAMVGDKQIHYLRQMESSKVDLALFMDVIEHVDDDIGLLQDYIKKVPHGTWFFITVPAFSWLWSEHDEFLEHRRRYSLNSLELSIKNSGLSIQKSGYLFALVFPIAAILRSVKKLLPKQAGPAQSELKQHHPLVNSVLSSLCEKELCLIPYNRLAGLSVYCLARS